MERNTVVAATAQTLEKIRIKTDITVNWTLQSAFVIGTVSMNLRIYRQEYYGMKLKKKTKKTQKLTQCYKTGTWS